MSEEADAFDVMGALRDHGALITGSHVVYTSGRHGRDYVNKDGIFPFTGIISRLAVDLMAKFAPDRWVDIVVGPAVGGAILAHYVAGHFSGFYGHQDVLAVYADKEADGSFVLRRGYDALVAGRQVLVVEDILTTGGTVRKVVEAVRNAGGTVIGVGAICNRGGVTAEQVGSVPQLTALINLTLKSWAEAECPLCRGGVAINPMVGKGREWLARKGG